MFIVKFVQFGFIQGDGDLGRLKSLTHKGLEINIGKDDDDIFPLFGLDKIENCKNYYITGFNKELKELGFSSKKLPERILPTTFNEWADNEKLSFLRGLFSANGSALKGYGRISFKTTCKELVYQIQSALFEFDIFSYITTNKSKKVKFSNGTYQCKESYNLNISRKTSVFKFMELIGFVHEYKNNKIYDYFNKKHHK